ncbi:MAG: hypothetical protein ABFD02_11105 [Bacteroidales bacterium]
MILKINRKYYPWNENSTVSACRADSVLNEFELSRAFSGALTLGPNRIRYTAGHITGGADAKIPPIPPVPWNVNIIETKSVHKVRILYS